MLKLDTQQYLQAATAMARALDRAETEGFKTFAGRTCAVLNALGEEFDVTPMDLREDTITDVWPETQAGSVQRLIGQRGKYVPTRAVRQGFAFGSTFESDDRCADCRSGDHSTEEHKTALNQRLLNEMKDHDLATRAFGLHEPRKALGDWQ